MCGAIRRCACGKRERTFRKERASASSALWRKRRTWSLCRWRAWATVIAAALAVPASRYIPAARRNGTSRSGTAAWSECSASGRAGPRRRTTGRRGRTRAFCWWCARGAARSRHSARSGKLTVSGVRSADTKRRWRACAPCSCTASAASRSATRPMRRRRPSPIAAWTARPLWIWS